MSVLSVAVHIYFWWNFIEGHPSWKCLSSNTFNYKVFSYIPSMFNYIVTKFLTTSQARLTTYMVFNICSAYNPKCIISKAIVFFIYPTSLLSTKNFDIHLKCYKHPLGIQRPRWGLSHQPGRYKRLWYHLLYPDFSWLRYCQLCLHAYEFDFGRSSQVVTHPIIVAAQTRLTTKFLSFAVLAAPNIKEQSFPQMSNISLVHGRYDVHLKYLICL